MADQSRVVRRVVLLGYMCAGKSTVGAALARRLEWSFVDLDAEIEHRTGGSVKALVAEAGQEAFRALEAELTRELADVSGVVLAPGGGWITQPGLLEVLGAGTLAVWLRVSPEEAVRRLRADAIDRPFRDLADPAPLVAEMMAQREPLYRLADLAVPVDDVSPETVAFEIEQLVRARALIRLA